MKKNKKMILFIVLISIALGVTIGCVAGKKEGNISKKNKLEEINEIDKEGEDYEEDTDEEDIDEKNTDEEEISMAVGAKDYDILNRSENISNLVVELYGIDNASSIIFNDIVVIAVEIGVDNSLTDDVKEMIITTVLANDTAIRQVLITDNKKTFDQIEDIIEDLMKGNPYDDYVKDINRIIEKLK